MKRILLIEDDETIAAIERDYLVLSGFAVDIAATGGEGRLPVRNCAGRRYRSG